MPAMKHRLALSVLCSALAAGCTTYTPRPSPRIAEVTSGYTRDGILIPHGFVGAGLLSAVQGNTAAEQYAAKYRRLLIGGFALDVTAAGLAGGGLGLSFGTSDPNAQLASYGLFAGAGLLLAIGLCLQVAAAPEKLDAINTYNDTARTGAPGPTSNVLPGPRRDRTADALFGQ